MRSAQLFRTGNAFRVFKPVWESSRTQKFGRSSVNLKDGEDLSADPYEGNYSFSECDRSTKVSVIGAAGRVGRTLSLLLKTCPLIDQLCLFDTDKSVKGVGVDISHIDTNCKVSYVCGMRNIQQALNAPDIVIIAAGCPATPQLNGKKLFDKNAPVIAGLSEACARFCPKACVILITSPINSLLPVVGGVYEIITNRVPSRKLFGLTTLDVVRANTFVAEVVRKDPNSIIVPVIGGTSQETIVPVISQMKPCCKIKRGEMLALTECLKRAEEDLIDCQNCGTKGASSLSTAYAGFRFTTSLVMALKGAENVVECAFVKSEVIPELEYLASPLKLGTRGIEFNFGYPPLSDHELAGLKQAVAVLMQDIEMGKTFVSNIEETVEKGLVWKRLIDGNEKQTEDWKAKHQKELQEKKKKKEEDERWQEVNLQPTNLRDEVYSEGMQNWAAKVSFGKFFDGEEIQENCREISSNSLSAEFASGTCRDDSSLQDLTTRNFSRNRMGNLKRTLQQSRGFHTISRQKELKEVKKCSRGYTDPFPKTLVPLKKGNNEVKNVLQLPTTESPTYKNLNAVAKQKYRIYNIQKKFAPSASFLLMSEKQKNAERMKSPASVISNRKVLVNEYKHEEPSDEMEEEPETFKQLILKKKNDDVFFEDQFEELRRENERLKYELKKLQNEGLEMERTKLEACWTIMSSTLDAFSGFCKKFLKTSTQVKNNEEETLQEGEHLKKLKKDLTYEQKYFNFLEKLMEDKLDTEMDGQRKTFLKK